MAKADTAVILAAGEGSRMRPLTYTMPKPMLPIAGRPVLHHIVGSFQKAKVRNIVMVVGYKKESIMKYFGDGNWLNVDISYAEQDKIDGTAHGFLAAKKLVDGPFIAANGDQLVNADDIKPFMKEDFAIGAFKIPNPERYGVLKVRNGLLEDIVEKPDVPPSDMINAGLYKFPAEAFRFMEQTKKSPRGEYEVTDSIHAMTGKGMKCKVIELGYWQDIGYPWQMLDVNEQFMKGVPHHIFGEIETGVTIKGNVRIGEGSVIKSGSYIEGPVVIGKNCVIGPMAYIRDKAAIGNDCKIGRFVELKNSIIMDHTKIQHHAYVGDSIIGENCNFGAGTKCANLRFDDKTVKVMVKSQRMDSGRRKMGVIMGSNAKTGINCVLMPGVKIGNESWIGPNAIVYQDVEDRKTVLVKQDLLITENEGETKENTG